MKTCSKCGIEKDLSEFHKKSSNKDGKANSCATCTKARVSAWRTTYPSKARAAELRRRQNNPEENRAWKKANPEKMKAAKRREWQKGIVTVSDRYLRRRWKSLKNATPEVLAAYRETMFARREAKEIQKLISSIEKEIENVTEAN